MKLMAISQGLFRVSSGLVFAFCFFQGYDDYGMGGQAYGGPGRGGPGGPMQGGQDAWADAGYPTTG